MSSDRAEIERLALLVLSVANAGTYPVHPTDPAQLYCSICRASAPMGPMGLQHTGGCPITRCQEALSLRGGGITTGPLAQCERCGKVQIVSELRVLSADGMDQYACQGCQDAFERQEARAQTT